VRAQGQRQRWRTKTRSPPIATAASARKVQKLRLRHDPGACIKKKVKRFVEVSLLVLVVSLLAYLWFAYNSFLIMLKRAANPVGAFAILYDIENKLRRILLFFLRGELHLT
jgi:hypothetical protein